MSFVLLSVFIVARLIMNFCYFWFVCLWVCEFVFWASSSMRLCVCVVFAPVYVCVVVWLCGYVVVCLCVIVRLWMFKYGQYVSMQVWYAS